MYRAFKGALQTYILRWKGEGEQHPPPPPWHRVCMFWPKDVMCYILVQRLELQIATFDLQTLLAWVGSYISLLLINGLQHWFGLPYSVPMLLATFGPTCALVFGMPTLPSSQPLNGIGKLPGTVVFSHVVYGCRVLVSDLPMSTACHGQRCLHLLCPSHSKPRSVMVVSPQALNE